MKKTYPKVVEDFQAHLIAAGKTEKTVRRYSQVVRRFLRHVGNTPLERLTEDQTREFFTAFKGDWRADVAAVIRDFLTFATERLPVVVNARGSIVAPGPAPKSKKEIALRRQWDLDRLAEQKNASDDLIAKLGRKLIDHYLYFQGRMKGKPDNLDDIARYADECRALIEANLPLLLGLSAEGKNIHPKIDERVQR